MNIEELGFALQGIADKTHAMADHLADRVLDRLSALRKRPARYVGRHRAPTLRQRLAASRAARQAERDLDRRHTVELADLAEWWAVRRIDYAPARGRVNAQWVMS